jgi:hypothetical protein
MGKRAASLCLILIVFLVACAGEPETPTVTFDGDGCSYEGPTELQTGVHSIAFKDLRDQNQEPYLDLWFVVGLPHDGHTYQDVLDLQSEPGEYFAPPDWLKPPLFPSQPWVWAESAGARVYTLRYDKAGEYVLWVERSKSIPLSLFGSWICGSIQVVGAADEL